jgi:hypothetical protein
VRGARCSRASAGRFEEATRRGGQPIGFPFNPAVSAAPFILAASPQVSYSAKWDTANCVRSLVLRRSLAVPPHPEEPAEAQRRRASRRMGWPVTDYAFLYIVKCADGSIVGCAKRSVRTASTSTDLMPRGYCAWARRVPRPCPPWNGLPRRSVRRSRPPGPRLYFPCYLQAIRLATRHRRPVLIFSSAAAPGHRSWSESWFNGAATVLRLRCRSSGSWSR